MSEARGCSCADISEFIHPPCPHTEQSRCTTCAAEATDKPHQCNKCKSADEWTQKARILTHFRDQEKKPNYSNRIMRHIFYLTNNTLFSVHRVNGNTIKQIGATLVGLSFFSSKRSDANQEYGPSLEIEDFSRLDSKDAFMAEPITERSKLAEEKSLMRRRMELFILDVQKTVFSNLVKIEQEELAKCLESDYANQQSTDKLPKKIEDIVVVDRWVRKEGGGGITCIIQEGRVFEKAGVNISVVYGMLPPAAVQQMKSRGKHITGSGVGSEQIPFFAAGVSSVIHPRNPNVPTIHFNYRYFELEQTSSNQQEGDGKSNSNSSQGMWWFGGGTDLTPYLLDESDCKHFHLELKRACDKHDSSYYGKFKKWCDDYFYIVHRNERRGVGGLFFDDLDTPDQERAFKFIRSCAHHILPSYMPLVRKNMHKDWTEQDREWQLIRRGRYTEFNLVYDRGTKFGLFTPGARYESILMSLPLYAKWLYCHEPEPGSNYAKLMEILRKPKDWI